MKPLIWQRICVLSIFPTVFLRLMTSALSTPGLQCPSSKKAKSALRMHTLSAKNILKDKKLLQTLLLKSAVFILFSELSQGCLIECNHRCTHGKHYKRCDFKCGCRSYKAVGHLNCEAYCVCTTHMKACYIG